MSEIASTLNGIVFWIERPLQHSLISISLYLSLSFPLSFFLSLSPILSSPSILCMNCSESCKHLFPYITLSNPRTRILLHHQSWIFKSQRCHCQCHMLAYLESSDPIKYFVTKLIKKTVIFGFPAIEVFFDVGAWMCQRFCQIIFSS